MQRTSQFFVLIVLSLATSLYYSSQAQLSSTQSEIREKYLAESIGWAWTNVPWNENVLPYRKIREGIDQELLLLGNSAKDQFLATYESKAMQHPHNPHTIFGWAYAVWATRNGAMTAADIYNRNFAPGKALTEAPFQANYEFARLRFLFQDWQQHPQTLRIAGERLVALNPEDADIKRRLAGIYEAGKSPVDRLRAVRLAQEAILLQPAYAAGYSILGSAYLRRWHEDKDVQGAQHAIMSYRKYLDIAPRTHVWRPQAQNIINQLQLELNRSFAGKALTTEYMQHYF